MVYVVPVGGKMMFPQKIEHRISSTVPPLDLYPKEIKAEAQSYICSPLYRAALFGVIHSNQR